MDGQGQAPTTIEQMTINHMVNIEALLDVLISKGVISEKDFLDAKARIERKIIEAQRDAGRRAE